MARSWFWIIESAVPWRPAQLDVWMMFTFNTAAGIVFFGGGAADRIGVLAAERLGSRVLVGDRSRDRSPRPASARSRLARRRRCGRNRFLAVEADPPEPV